MADGYARSTGKPGVCLATSGPGATNLVTGIATAFMDSVPIVCLTGQVPTPLIGNDAFQEADVTGITRPITKHNYLVKSVDDLSAIIKEAFYLAQSGRPGPVLVDIPKDVQKSATEVPHPKEVHLPGYRPTYEGHIKQIQKAAEAIKAAKKPVIYAGGGVLSSNATDDLRHLAHKANIPVTTTLMGLGAFDETDPLALKMLGMHGTKYANMAVHQTDLLIAIGARFDDRVTGKCSEFAKWAKIIHIDIDPSSISKNIQVHIPVVGDCKKVLHKLNNMVEPGDYREWHETIKRWKEESPLRYNHDETGEVKPQYVIEQTYEATQGDAIVTTDVGQHQMWAAQFYQHRHPRSFITSGGLGTMGYGFPAAIGAQVGNPDKTVICFAGDGSVQMNVQELATACNHDLPLNVFIINNRYLGMVRQWQRLFYERNYSYTSLADTARSDAAPKRSREQTLAYRPDFVKLAQAYGAVGLRVDRPKDVRPAIDESIKTKKTVWVDFMVAPEEDVWPMVPSGASIADMIDEYTLL